MMFKMSTASARPANQAKRAKITSRELRLGDDVVARRKQIKLTPQSASTAYLASEDKEKEL